MGILPAPSLAVWSAPLLINMMAMCSLNKSCRIEYRRRVNGEKPSLPHYVTRARPSMSVFSTCLLLPAAMAVTDTGSFTSNSKSNIARGLLMDPVIFVTSSFNIALYNGSCILPFLCLAYLGPSGDTVLFRGLIPISPRLIHFWAIVTTPIFFSFAV